MKIGDLDLDLGRPQVMSIINVTPDSFYSFSRSVSESDIIRSVDIAVSEGADILDVGGYSSRPGADEVSPEAEYSRVSKALEIIRSRYPAIPVSIDSFRSDVVGRCIDTYGPCIVNDISAGELDSGMLSTVSAFGVPYIAMHMRGTPADMQQYTQYDDVTEDVRLFFESKIGQLLDSGIREDHIILDPGFGFSKTLAQNYQLMRGLYKLCNMGYPVLVGVSRKSMIYKITGSEPADAMSGTLGLQWESLRQGASILRVHDTRAAVDLVKIFNYYKHS